MSLLCFLLYVICFLPGFIFVFWFVCHIDIFHFFGIWRTYNLQYFTKFYPLIATCHSCFFSVCHSSIFPYFKIHYYIFYCLPFVTIIFATLCSYVWGLSLLLVLRFWNMFGYVTLASRAIVCSHFCTFFFMFVVFVYSCQGYILLLLCLPYISLLFLRLYAPLLLFAGHISHIILS